MAACDSTYTLKMVRLTKPIAGQVAKSTPKVWEQRPFLGYCAGCAWRKQMSRCAPWENVRRIV